MESRILPVHSLTKDELQYEVSIRSETPEGTVDKLRRQLKILVQQISSEDILEVDRDPKQEIKAIEDKFEILKEKIAHYTISRDRGSLVRAKALAIHLHHRASRLIIGEDKESSAFRERIVKSIAKVLSEVEEEVGPKFSEAQDLSTVSDSESDEVQHKPTVIQCSKSIVSVTKWGLRFDGTTDVRSFLERAEELATAHNVSSSNLFLAASEIFVDQALLWFRGIRSQVSSWQELRSILLKEFDPVDYEYRLIGEIRARTQGADEPIHIYFSIMNCMFSRLQHALSEDAKLEILLHNIRPYFSEQLALFEITSVQSLKDKCRRLEAARQRSEFFAEPSRSQGRTLNPSFAYKAGKAKGHVAAVTQQLPVSKSHNQHNQKPADSKTSSESEVLCFKCGEPGHVYKSCKNKRSCARVKCFSCGELGYTTKSCPKCSTKKPPRSSVAKEPKN